MYILDIHIWDETTFSKVRKFQVFKDFKTFLSSPRRIEKNFVSHAVSNFRV